MLRNQFPEPCAGKDPTTARPRTGLNFGRTGRFSLRTAAPTSAGSSRIIYGPLGGMTRHPYSASLPAHLRTCSR